uniref:Uncharacterized protein LOC109547311 n=1 Tax=Tursiops truncatus TaxID=9739 RepID=A0A2U4A201_TURTR|nr:uncharacterized protein LOC109547311 [Tursiops truncatus]
MVRKHSEVKEGGNVAWRRASWSSGRGRWHSYDVRGTAGPGAPAGGQHGCRRRRRRRAAWDPGGGDAVPPSTTRGRPTPPHPGGGRGTGWAAGKEGSRGEAFWGGWGGGESLLCSGLPCGQALKKVSVRFNWKQSRLSGPEESTRRSIRAACGAGVSLNCCAGSKTLIQVEGKLSTSRWGNRGTEKQSDLPRATQPVGGRASLQTQVFLSPKPTAPSCLTQ